MPAFAGMAVENRLRGSFFHRNDKDAGKPAFPAKVGIQKRAESVKSPLSERAYLSNKTRTSPGGIHFSA